MSAAYDAIVVGARCAGSAVAIALARAGRRVVAIDRATFPADTISTHLLWPGGIAELRALGALPAVQELGAPPLPVAFAGGGGVTVRADYAPVDGIDYALCVRRPGLDAALVGAARAAGAEVREGTRVTDLIWADARVAGVRLDGGEELRAPLVVGADGRRSLVARAVGADEPHHEVPSGRSCFYAYWEDVHSDWLHIAAQWREGRELGTAFPCDGGLTLVLLQPPVERDAEFRADLAGAYARTVAAIPGLAERLRGCAQATKVRSATGIASYFRRSTGPGWALVGDAGHFKDPVTAQGIRDALRYGRLLGEAVARGESLEAWERRRDAECAEVYQWTNRLARAEPMTALETELFRLAAARPALGRELTSVYARGRLPTQALTPLRGAALALLALARGDRPRIAVAREIAHETATRLREARERRGLVAGPQPYNGHGRPARVPRGGARDVHGADGAVAAAAGGAGARHR